MTSSVASFGSSRFLKYLAVGGVATLIDFLVLNILIILRGPLIVATSVGYLTGFLTSYILNSRWTFQTTRNWQSMRRFTLMNVVGLILTNIIVLTGVNLGSNHNIAKVIAVIIVFFWNYLVSKYWVYAPRKQLLRKPYPNS